MLVFKELPYEANIRWYTDSELIDVPGQRSRFPSNDYRLPVQRHLRAHHLMKLELSARSSDTAAFEPISCHPINNCLSRSTTVRDDRRHTMRSSLQYNQALSLVPKRRKISPRARFIYCITSIGEHHPVTTGS